jgi:hypothetical protein
MSINNTPKKITSRRGFFKKLIAGAGGLALANSLREYLMSDQSSVLAAPVETLSADATIYGKFFLRSNGEASIANDLVSISSHSTIQEKSNPELHHGEARTLPGATATIGWQVFEEPVCWETSHTHTHDELLIFRGMELHDLRNSFDAEIDLWIGEEMEKHTITSTTVVFIPKGVQHAPLNFRAIRKPVLFHASPVHLP